ncbi:MAG: hypothetical protein Q8P76_00975 [bacterium]|nr:hypothetical protein [bacterium]
MTYRQFLRELRKLRNKGTWYLTSTDGIRMSHSDSDMIYDPITVVCKFFIGKEYFSDEWANAAKRLNLDRKVMGLIMVATCFSLDHCKTKNNPRFAKVRQDLLEAIGLSE